MSCILDASTTLAWLLPDELTAAVNEVFSLVLEQDSFVPPLWRIEIANSLSVSVRRKRITAQQRDEQLHDLLALPILDDFEGESFVWSKTLALADKHQLTVYDATYLELALRRSLPLATLDRDLRKAAEAEGVTLLGL